MLTEKAISYQFGKRSVFVRSVPANPHLLMKHRSLRSLKGSSPEMKDLEVRVDAIFNMGQAKKIHN